MSRKKYSNPAGVLANQMAGSGTRDPEKQAMCPVCGGELGKPRQIIVAGRQGVPRSLAVCRQCNREWITATGERAEERKRGEQNG